MAAKTKSKKITEQQLITAFMDHTLEHGEFPSSVYKFCKAQNLEEPLFYEIFGSLQSLKKRVWTSFYDHTFRLLEKNKEFERLSNRDKMLTFFFTFFELLTLNRSYVLFALNREQGMLKNLEQLKGLRKQVKSFAIDLIEDANAEKALKITKYNKTVFSEAAWIQFLFILKFWKDDESAGFEKTDVAIEKSINTIFDVFDNTPLDNIIDFGKFLFKESIA